MVGDLRRDESLLPFRATAATELVRRRPILQMCDPLMLLALPKEHLVRRQFRLHGRFPAARVSHPPEILLGRWRVRCDPTSSPLWNTWKLLLSGVRSVARSIVRSIPGSRCTYVSATMGFCQERGKVHAPVSVSEEPFNPLSRIPLGESVVAHLEARPTLAMPPPAFLGAGVYAIYYYGSYALYKEIAGPKTPIYVGSAVPKGGRIGGVTRLLPSAPFSTGGSLSTLGRSSQLRISTSENSNAGTSS